ncbi:hypothetical protein ABT336_17675 [Micromonospora sp. NPDC000207]|uniref:hypothetical protein n=1 Tax=Micromonospora sp. NPDC000207 TaxID=3154246 RepID=UPI00331E0B5A
MRMDRTVAARIAEKHLTRWRRLGYDRWYAMLDEKETLRVADEAGTAYTVVVYALDDGEGRIRLCVAVDDGGWSAFRPSVRAETMRPDGTLVD